MALGSSGECPASSVAFLATFLATLWLAGCRPDSGVVAASRNRPVAPSAASHRGASSMISADPAPPQDAAPRPKDVALPPLFRRFPALEGRVPWLRLANLPTPVEPLEGLGGGLGGAQVYVKRDDRSHDRYGGGKIRKLEPLLADALAQGHPSVAVWGGVGSNQAVATAIHARALGLGVSLLLLPQPPSEAVTFNLLASLQYGATVRRVGSKREALDGLAALAKPTPEGSNAYVIEAGGSSPRGNLGFVNAGLELDQQIAEGALPEPSAVYVAMGSMGSAVGLAIGLALAERSTRVVAVRASNPGTSSPARFRRMFDDTIEHLVALDSSVRRLSFDDVNVVLDGSQVGAGYARPTRAGTAARREAQRRHGLRLESTYTAKAFAALLRHQVSSPGEVVLYWHTHGELDCTPHVDASRIPQDIAPYVQHYPLDPGGEPCDPSAEAPVDSAAR